MYCTFPNPREVENQGPQAPPRSEHGSSLVSASIRGPPHRCTLRAPGWICLGGGLHYGLREMVQSWYESLAYSATAATSSSSPSSSVSVLI